MKKMYIITLLMSTVAAATVFAADNCPTLNPGNIGEAACSTIDKPFITSTMSSVKFHAISPCPSGIWKKTLQSWFKKAKDYEPICWDQKSKKDVPCPQGKDVTPGKATCSYKLDASWQKALGVKSDTLKFDIGLPTREHANYWSPTSLCQALRVKQQTIEEILDGKLTYTRDIKDTDTDSHQITYTLVPKGVSKPLRFILPNGTQPAGKGVVETPFEVTCSYRTHLDSDPNGQEIKIKGVQAIKR